MIRFSLVISLGLMSLYCFSQKKIIDTTDLKRGFGGVLVSEGHISPDGNYVLWKEDQFKIQSSNGRWNAIIPGARSITITDDSKRLIFQAGEDSLCIWMLGSHDRQYIKGVSDYKLSKSSNEFLAYLKTNQTLEILSLLSNQQSSYDSVTEYIFNKQGTVLVVKQRRQKGNKKSQTFTWIDLSSGNKRQIWSSVEEGFAYTKFNESGDRLFIKVNDSLNKFQSLWLFNSNVEKANLKLTDTSIGDHFEMDPSSECEFSKDSKWLFFRLKKSDEKMITLAHGVQVDVYSYADPKLQATQLTEINDPESYWAVIPVNNPAKPGIANGVTIIEHTGDQLLTPPALIAGEYAIVANRKGGSGEDWWNVSSMPAVYLVSLRDGKKREIKNYQPYRKYWSLDFSLSPKAKYVVYFDNVGYNKLAPQWYSYEVATDITRCITKQIKVPLTVFGDLSDSQSAKYWPYEVVGWNLNDSEVLIADQYDIWRISLSSNVAPINLTEGIGRKNKIKFKIINRSGEPYKDDDTVFFTAVNQLNKNEGLYQKSFRKKDSIKLLTMGSYTYTGLIGPSLQPVKAKYAYAWLWTQQTASDAPNYFYTRNWKDITRLSNIQPQNDFNWLSSELITWKMSDGHYSQGILYKPENFDSLKKYPIIFYYYEKESQNANAFLPVRLTGDVINIPFYVSQGYLVFTPDIHYQPGQTGDNALQHVVSSANLLMQRIYIDGEHMGLQGHSFGGFETNYIITHTDLFAAAVSSAGMSDFISEYGSISFGSNSRQNHYETGSNHMDASLWEHPERYINNSPVLFAHHTTTPLLMMHNKQDDNVPYTQGIEFYTALRRLGKRVWMLQYDGSDHWVKGSESQTDYHIRMKQFFDHYLKGALPPKWMTEGIPASSKGRDTGYKLDASGKVPEERPVLFDGKIQLVRDALKAKPRKTYQLIF
jgi:dienelactone hydrolase